MRKSAESALPDGIRQREMREEIIGRLDRIIDGWNPKFAELSSELGAISNLKNVSDQALEALKQARDELSEMMFPRKDRRVCDCYSELLTQTEKLLKVRVQTSFAGDKIIQPSADAVLSAVRVWSALD